MTSYKQSGKGEERGKVLKGGEYVNLGGRGNQLRGREGESHGLHEKLAMYNIVGYSFSVMYIHAVLQDKLLFQTLKCHSHQNLRVMQIRNK